MPEPGGLDPLSPLANLDADAYEGIGRDLKAMAQQALEEWRSSKGQQR